MLRLSALRLGGGMRHRRTPTAVIDAAVRAAFAELFPPATRARVPKAALPSKVKPAKRKGKRAASRPRTPAPSTPAASTTEKPRQQTAERAALAATDVKAPAPSNTLQPQKKAAASVVAASPAAAAASKSLVDAVLSGVNCILLKHVLSSSSSSSTSTDIPDVARVLRLDYTTVARHHQLAHLADILLVNRIHAAVIADVREHGDAYASAAANGNGNGSHYNASAPLVVLVETTLPNEEAEVQQFIIRNALQMHPLPAEVRTKAKLTVRTPPLTVLVLGGEHTARVRALAELPPVPSRVPDSVAEKPVMLPKATKGAATEAAKATPAASAVSAPAATPPTTPPLVDTEPTPARATPGSSQEQETAPRKLSPAVETAKARASAATLAPLKEPAAAPTTAATPKSAVAAKPVAASATPRVPAATPSTAVAPPPSPASPADAPSAASEAAAATAAATAPPATASAPNTTRAASAAAAAPVATAAPVPRGFVPIVPPPPIPVEAFAESALTSTVTANAIAEARKGKLKTVPKVLSKREAQRLTGAARRAARAQVRAIVSATRRRLATPSQARLAAALTAATGASMPRPPRLLPTGSTKEKLLWASRPGRPLPVRVLAPLINPTAYAAMCSAATPATATAESALHAVVYSVSRESSVATVWLGALQAAADLASAVSAGTSKLPTAVADLAGLTASVAKTPASDGPADTTAESTESSTTTTTPPPAPAEAPISAAAPAAHVYILVHTTLSPDDAAVLQQELQYQFTQLRTTPAGVELAGLSVLTAQDVSSAQLSYVLEHAVDDSCSSGGNDGSTGSVRVGQSAVTYGARGGRPAVSVPATAAAAATAPPLSPEAAEAKKTFAEVYRLMLELPGLASPSSRALSSSPSAQHPDALVADAVAVAALTQVLLHRKEAHLRAELAAAQQSNAATADSEAVARAAQRVEMKTMVTEAVEEVSVRHEQATAHLVKTLSSMVGQWSLEKLSDTLETIIRDEVKPIMDVLEERLGSAATAVATEAPPATTAASASPSATSTPSASPAESGDTEEDEVAAAALQHSMAQVLAQLRELTQRTGTLAEAATAAAATAAASAASISASTEGAGSAAANASPGGSVADRDVEAAAARARSEEEAQLLRDLHERHQQHEARLSAELDELKSELQSLSTEARTAAAAAASAAAAATAASAASSAVETPAAAAASPSLSPESLEKAVADAMHDVTQTLRRTIQTSVIQQLDAYCDVHRNGSSSSGDGGYDHHEPSMPVLPVTSFELEEMLGRVVEHTVQSATDEMEGHVRAAVEKAVASELAAAAPSSPRTATPAAAAPMGGLGDADESVKAALESLWAQVRAEAAEEEAVKTSQHNRQLLRLFRRQQHLQRGAAPAPTTPMGSVVDTPGALPLSYVALEEALRTVMRPYMTHMQASMTAASAAAAVAATSPSASSASSHEKMSSSDAPAHSE